MKAGRKKLKRLRKRTEFSRVLAGLLKGHGMTPAELARRAGLHRSLTSRILTGTTYMVDGEHVVKIARQFARKKDRAQLIASYARDCLAGCRTGAAMMVKISVTAT